MSAMVGRLATSRVSVASTVSTPIPGVAAPLPPPAAAPSPPRELGGLALLWRAFLSWLGALFRPKG